MHAGIHFTEMNWSPVVRYNESQPHTVALAESHVWFDDEQELVVLFHTVRWDRKNSPNPVDPPFTKDPFAPGEWAPSACQVQLVL
jgi:hypothetical protein